MSIIKIISIAIFFIPSFLIQIKAQNLYVSKNASAEFLSVAPLETIYAKSTKLKGIIDIQNRSFAFEIPMNSFDGFNSPLQKTHFNENYLESTKYPKAKFTGKIIEEIDFSKPGEYQIRAKGKMLIHGKEEVMTISGKISITQNSFKILSVFSIFLKNFDISIPPIVNQKIADEIKVTVKAEFNPKI